MRVTNLIPGELDSRCIMIRHITSAKEKTEIVPVATLIMEDNESMTKLVNYPTFHAKPKFSPQLNYLLINCINNRS